jgi:hypothetical protein
VAAPSTPDLGPSVACLISTRCLEVELDRSCTSLRAGSKIKSPAYETPPPTAITSGSTMFTKVARPIPSQVPVSCSTFTETSSPLRARSSTSSPSGARSAASLPKAESGRSLATLSSEHD